MSEANGQPRDPISEASAAFEAALAWLPFWSDRQRGKLRAVLCRGDMVRREGITPPKGEEQSQ